MSDTKVCGFFLEGTCRRGRKCRFLHLAPNGNGNTPAAAATPVAPVAPTSAAASFAPPAQYTPTSWEEPAKPQAKTTPKPKARPPPESDSSEPDLPAQVAVAEQKRKRKKDREPEEPPVKPKKAKPKPAPKPAVPSDSSSEDEPPQRAKTPRQEPKAKTPKAKTPQQELKAKTPRQEPKAKTPRQEPKEKTPRQVKRENKRAKKGEMKENVLPHRVEQGTSVLQQLVELTRANPKYDLALCDVSSWVHICMCACLCLCVRLGAGTWHVMCTAMCPQTQRIRQSVFSWRPCQGIWRALTTKCRTRHSSPAGLGTMSCISRHATAPSHCYLAGARREICTVVRQWLPRCHCCHCCHKGYIVPHTPLAALDFLLSRLHMCGHACRSWGQPPRIPPCRHGLRDGGDGE